MEKKILLIDDDRSHLHLTRRELEKMDMTVLLAQDGREGVALFRRERPGIVILDYRMPEMDGLQVLKELRSEGLHNYATIMAASEPSDAVINQCYDLGIHAFMTKPLNFPILKGMITRAFQLQNYSRRLKDQILVQERTFRLLQTTVDNMNEGVVALDSQLRIMMASNRACSILGIDKDGAVGEKVEELLGPGIIATGSPLMQCIQDGIRLAGQQTRLDTPAGESKTVALTINPIAGKQSPGWVLHFRDLRKADATPDPGLENVSFGKLVSADPKMKDVFGLIDEVARSNASVLIQGESGTGKELAAWEIHSRSNRSCGPFHVVNCAAVPEALLESEFFGHEKGSFTGAFQTRKGRFEMAHNGTLFLDEVAEMPMEVQGKLLRVLQEQRFERLGGVETIEVDIRILAATNKNLKEMVRAGKFREDLYYRLKVFPITMPPLRKRVLDIPHLVTLHLKKISEREGRVIRHVSPNAMQRLMEHQWPGNVRELLNVLEFCFVVCKEPVIQTKHLPREFHYTITSQPGHNTIGQAEKDFLLQTLKMVNYRKGKAAERLGIHPSTLYRKMRKYGLLETS